ncbi:MAG TPA: hypothetical protein VN280_19880 [Variovorax sp.]|nr:hypothetical protein [Variovorax sp.]
MLLDFSEVIFLLNELRQEFETTDFSKLYPRVGLLQIRQAQTVALSQPTGVKALMPANGGALVKDIEEVKVVSRDNHKGNHISRAKWNHHCVPGTWALIYEANLP